MHIDLVRLDSHAENIAIEKLPALLGRDMAAEVCVDDSFVSRYQCLLDLSDEGLVLLDLGSKTGTFVNGQRVRRAVLSPGDKLTVGRAEFVVEYGPAASGFAGWENQTGLFAG